jgi:hypothetical protein
MSQTKRKSNSKHLTRRKQTRSKRGGNMIQDLWQKTSSYNMNSISSSNWNPMNWMKKKETYTPINTTYNSNTSLSGGKEKRKRKRKINKSKKGGNNCGGGYGSGFVQGSCLPDNVEPYIREPYYPNATTVSGYTPLKI